MVMSVYGPSASVALRVAVTSPTTATAARCAMSERLSWCSVVAGTELNEHVLAIASAKQVVNRIEASFQIYPWHECNCDCAGSTGTAGAIDPKLRRIQSEVASASYSNINKVL
jgi:hypothetical protein